MIIKTSLNSNYINQDERTDEISTNGNDSQGHGL